MRWATRFRVGFIYTVDNKESYKWANQVAKRKHVRGLVAVVTHALAHGWNRLEGEDGRKTHPFEVKHHQLRRFMWIVPSI